MNEPCDASAEQLRRATNRSLSADQPLEAEAAALRDGWLALGRAIDAENAGFHEEAFLARLISAGKIAQQSSASISLASKSSPQFSNLGPLLLAGALAIALFVAVVRTLSVGTAEKNIVKTPARPAENLPEMVVPRALVFDRGTPPDSAQSSQEQTTIAAWSDPLDDEIEEALAQVRSAVGRRGTVDDSLANLQQQLEQLGADMADGSL